MGRYGRILLAPSTQGPHTIGQSDRTFTLTMIAVTILLPHVPQCYSTVVYVFTSTFFQTTIKFANPKFPYRPLKQSLYRADVIRV